VARRQPQRVARTRSRTELTRAQHTLAPPYAFALYAAFDQIDAQLLVGRDKWLFVRPRAEPSHVPDEEIASRAATSLLALQRRLADNGIRLLAVPIPRKEYLCARQLPPGFDARLGLDPTVFHEFERRGVDHVDLLSAYSGQKELLYHRYGSHWNDLAQRIAAETVAKDLGLLKPLKKRWGRLVTKKLDWGDFDLLVGPAGFSRERSQRYANDQARTST
jgi:hypothetical protein